MASIAGLVRILSNAERMDDQRTDRESGEVMTQMPATFVITPSRRRLFRFRLLWVLLLFVPLSISLSYYSHVRQLQLQKLRIHDAHECINRLGFNAHFDPNGDIILYARSANITDKDLRELILIGNREADIGKVIRIDLHGSRVSDEAAAEFRRAAPDCELVL